MRKTSVEESIEGASRSFVGTVPAPEMLEACRVSESAYGPRGGLGW